AAPGRRRRPARLGPAGARRGAARRRVRAVVRDADLDGLRRERRVVLGVLPRQLRPAEDARGVARGRAAGGAPPRLGRLLREGLPRRRCDPLPARVAARPRHAPLARHTPPTRPQGDGMAFEQLKEKQSVMWGNGPYERVTETLADAHDVVVGRIAAQPGERWLDLATGTGAVARKAARAGGQVTGIDLSPAR